MAEYVEREAVLKFIENGLNNSDKLKAFGHDAVEIMAEIQYMPAADVAPVVHGRLVLRAVSDVTSTFMCSECGREFEIANAYFGTPTNHPNKNYPYCNCGARMDGE